MKGLLREPLVHFLAIGAGLFLLYAALAPQRPSELGSRIEITEDDLRQMDIAWTVKWRRPPTPAEWRGLIDEQVREEILYREALKMGLDQGDEIVRRRLGQKLEFLMEDVSSLGQPTTDELRSWYQANSAQFALPGRATFCHIYFSPDRGRAEARAEAAMKELQGRASCQASAALGDRFPDYDYYANRDPDEVANTFGSQFSKILFDLPTGSWQGPVQSGLGWHLVLVEAMQPGRVPAFGEVDRKQVESSWVDAQRAEMKRRAFDAMRANYEVVVAASPAR